MSLVKCTECGHDVSEKADHCMYCGCPVSEILLEYEIIRKEKQLRDKNDEQKKIQLVKKEDLQEENVIQKKQPIKIVEKKTSYIIFDNLFDPITIQNNNGEEETSSYYVSVKTKNNEIRDYIEHEYCVDPLIIKYLEKNMFNNDIVDTQIEMFLSNSYFKIDYKKLYEIISKKQFDYFMKEEDGRIYKFKYKEYILKFRCRNGYGYFSLNNKKLPIYDHEEIMNILDMLSQECEEGYIDYCNTIKKNQENLKKAIREGKNLEEGSMQIINNASRRERKAEIRGKNKSLTSEKCIYCHKIIKDGNMCESCRLIYKKKRIWRIPIL